MIRVPWIHEHFSFAYRTTRISVDYTLNTKAPDHHVGLIHKVLVISFEGNFRVSLHIAVLLGVVYT